MSDEEQGFIVIFVTIPLLAAIVGFMWTIISRLNTIIELLEGLQ